MPKLINLNLVNIDTNYSIAPADAGFGTVAYLNLDNNATQPKLEKYTDINQMTNYDPSSPVYNAANYYFNGGDNNNLFEVITGNKGSANVSAPEPQSQDSNNNFDVPTIKKAISTLKSVIASNDTEDTIAPPSNPQGQKLLADNSYDNGSLLGFISSLTGNRIPDVIGGNGTSVSVKDGASHALSELQDYVSSHNINLNPAPAPSNNSNASTPSDNSLVSALKKYYNNGAEYYLFNVDNSNSDEQQMALKLADLVENQSSGVLMINIKTANSQPDLSWAKPMANDKSVMVVSLPNSDMLGAALLGVRASQSPKANIEMVNNLSGISPQDAYSFTVDDYTKYYEPYQVATYCYRNGIPMLTDGNSASGYQWSNMITRDWLNYQIIGRITRLLTKNNGDPGIPYTPQGVQLVVSQLRLVLSGASHSNIITDYHVHDIDFNKIPQREIAKGELNGLSYDWSPAQNVTSATFHQTINLPNMN